jgi:hypothetical protein
MEAWKTHCPRLSAWEDAIAAGFVDIIRGATSSESIVRLTEAGHETLVSAGG